jgi:hypothetical protein
MLDGKKLTIHFRHYLSIILILGWLLNFIAFVAIAMYLGGDAINGKIENDHYYLANHGVYTEVSHTVFIYSKIHAITFIVTHFLMFIYVGALYLLKRYR